MRQVCGPIWRGAVSVISALSLLPESQVESVHALSSSPGPWTVSGSPQRSQPAEHVTVTFTVTSEPAVISAGAGSLNAIVVE
jgi:hypothetical protein